MLSKMKKSVVICMNSLISVIIFCMIIMLLCSCVSAARTTWKQAKKTYHSMVEYYTRDVENNLRNISDYLLRISETADYYGMHLQCEIEPEAEISMVPAMCVLTFVENAIKYSTDFSNDLMIVVSAKVEGDNIKIEIQDNGEGIEENILKKINQNEKIVKNDREHIGIKNIVDRMHMHYGEAASVKVTNRDSGGVSVVINVPK